ncbi:MAG: hypothetical protein J5725_08085 [Bacteroidales bacterium]|nr:hypothetical protein [Bacteroidales bacterium]
MEDDWRRQGQDEYLKGIKLYYKKYKAYSEEWDHDHCEFCGEKFSEKGDTLKAGYTTENNYYWICDQCYNDFKDEFEWEIGNIE